MFLDDPAMKPEDYMDNNGDEPFAVPQRSKSFVGTPLYVSPEMLGDSISGPFNDIWALGVIVY